MLEGANASGHPAFVGALYSREPIGFFEEIRSVPTDHRVRVDNRNPSVVTVLPDEQLGNEPPLNCRWHVPIAHAAEGLVKDHKLDPMAFAPPLPACLTVFCM